MSDGEEKSRREEGDKERGRTAGRGIGWIADGSIWGVILGSVILHLL